LATKRVMDLALGSFGLLVSLPILVAIRLWMLASGDRGPFLFRARRVGEGGRLMTVLKIRTMTPDAPGSAITTAGDRRVTPVGRTLRRYRLDELPQLINVVRGEMSLVGPRPEDPAYVDFSNPDHRRVFAARPGITGLAQLAFHDEAKLLSGADAERRYRDEILPAKVRLDLEYLDRRTTLLDARILVRTIGTVLGRAGAG